MGSKDSSVLTLKLVVHYDSRTGKRKTCFIVNILKRKDSEEQKLGEPKKRHFSAEVPPEAFWGESTLYNKIGDIANRFHHRTSGKGAKGCLSIQTRS